MNLPVRSFRGARRFDIPLLADPLSQLRNYADAAIIDNYDNIFGRETCPDFDVVVRFGRYPVSKCVFKTLETKPHIQIVVDPLETRDFDAATTTFVKCDPLAFVTSFGGTSETSEKSSTPNIDRWAEANEAEAALITSVEDASFVYTCTREGCFNQEIALEGAYVQALIEHAAPRSLIFSANSMAIRALDTFYVKPSTPDAEVVELGAPRASRACDVTAARKIVGSTGSTARFPPRSVQRKRMTRPIFLPEILRCSMISTRSRFSTNSNCAQRPANRCLRSS